KPREELRESIAVPAAKLAPAPPAPSTVVEQAVAPPEPPPAAAPMKHVAATPRAPVAAPVPAPASAPPVIEAATGGENPILAEAARDADAKAAYDALLSRKVAPDVEERALFGRASCRARLSDEGGAREDLARYLERFPNGAHAADARARLGQ